MKRKVCAVVTARPSYSRIRTVLRAIEEHPDLELDVVVAASALLDRYGSAVTQIENDKFRIAAKVYMVIEGENLATMAKTTGLGLMELSTIFDNLKPDIVITIADRYETLATAVAAAYMNIPLAHIQGGEITGSIDEKVRHAITKLADIHLVCTAQAAVNVIRMGEESSRVFNTGCPSVDIAAQVMKAPELDFDPIDKYGGVGEDVNWRDGYIVVMHHPVTTEYDKALVHVFEVLHAIDEMDVPTFWFWPNVDAGSDGTSKGIRSYRETKNSHNIKFFKNMSPEDFLRVLYNSRCLVGNSSVGIRECSFLGIPVVNIGSRQGGRERGHNVMDVGNSKVDIVKAIKSQLQAGRYPNDRIYGDSTAGRQIADILADVELVYEKKLKFL